MCPAGRELVRLEVVDVDDLHHLAVVFPQLRGLGLGDEPDRERLAHLAGQVERRDAPGLHALDTELLLERLGRDRELERLLGRKTLENEILKDAIEIAREKKLLSRSPLPKRDGSR